MARREKRPLGEVFGVKNLGVNLTRLAPGGESSLLHRHSKQDEFDPSDRRRGAPVRRSTR